MPQNGLGEVSQYRRSFRSEKQTKMYESNYIHSIELNNVKGLLGRKPCQYATKSY